MVGRAGCGHRLCPCDAGVPDPWFGSPPCNKEVEDISYRAYRILLHGIFATIVVFFLMGDRIMWINCLSGFAWRTWLLLYCLPEWFALFEATAGLSRAPRK